MIFGERTGYAVDVVRRANSAIANLIVSGVLLAICDGQQTPVKRRMPTLTLKQIYEKFVSSVVTIEI